MNHRAEEYRETTLTNANRSAPRVDFKKRRVSILYKLISDSCECSDDVCEARLIDLSIGGLCAEGSLPSDCMMSLGDGEILVGCNLMTDGEEPIKLLGQVRWLNRISSDRYRFGLQFVKLQPEHAIRLKNFLIQNQLFRITGRYKRPK